MLNFNSRFRIIKVISFYNIMDLFSKHIEFKTLLGRVDKINFVLLVDNFTKIVKCISKKFLPTVLCV